MKTSYLVSVVVALGVGCGSGRSQPNGTGVSTASGSSGGSTASSSAGQSSSAQSGSGSGDSGGDSGMSTTGLETNVVAGCTVPAIPSFNELLNDAKLPDPFTMMSGAEITQKSEWPCRRAEISAALQQYEYGPKPPKPDQVSGTATATSITVNVTQAGKSTSFTATVTLPTTGTAPYPALIGVNGSFLDNAALASLGVAVISFPADDIAAENDATSRGQGKFYDVYGSTHPAGALMAWAWGVSRLIDVIEQTPSSQIDPARIGVTGCSRNGKGALAAGAFDERIVLTIPQESGEGGAGGWRTAAAMQAAGINVETLGAVMSEDPWFASAFGQFQSATNKLPFDQHEAHALVAPRALLLIENSAFVWLGDQSTFTTASAASTVWQALGIPDHMAFTQLGHPDHCGLPAAQEPDVEAYVTKFLIGGGTASTTFFKTDASLTYDTATWQNWAVPALQ